MLSKSQKVYLKSLCNTLKPLVMIGKNGITDSVIETTEEVLVAKELVKVSVLESCELSIDEVAIELARVTNSEIIYKIGRKVCLYRRNLSKNIIELPR